MIGRKLGLLAEGTFASPDYLARHGTPRSPDALDRHRMIGFVSSASRTVMPLEFQSEGGVRLVTLAVSVTVSAAATNAGLARLGLGLIQVPRYRVVDDLARGALVEVLAGHPPTPSLVYLLYPEGRQLSPRVRSFMDWATTEISGQLLRAGG